MLCLTILEWQNMTNFSGFSSPIRSPAIINNSIETGHQQQVSKGEKLEQLRLESLVQRGSSSLGSRLIPPTTIRTKSTAQQTGASGKYDRKLEQQQNDEAFGSEDPIKSYIKSVKLEQRILGSKLIDKKQQATSVNNIASRNMNRISSSASHSALNNMAAGAAAAERQARVSMRKQMNAQRASRETSSRLPPEVAAATSNSSNNNNINQQNQTEIWNSIDDLFWVSSNYALFFFP